MSNRKRHILTYSVLILISGCAHYNPSTLCMLSTETAIPAKNNPDVLISWKPFNEDDCLDYLDRDVLSEGYIPVQVTIRNNSQDPLYLSPDNFSVPLSSPNEVSRKVHTSTCGRIVAWGVGGLIFFPLFIPAVLDGIKSIEANHALDADYAVKSLKEQVIQAYSVFNGLVFVPKQYANHKIEMYLVNQKTSQKVAFSEMELK